MYYFSFDVPVAEDTYIIILTAETTLGETVYQTASIESKTYPVVSTSAINAIADQTWDELKSGHTTQGSMAEYLATQAQQDDIEGAVNGNSAALTTIDGIVDTINANTSSIPTAASIADAVWDEDVNASHTTLGSAGQRLDQAYDLADGNSAEIAVNQGILNSLPTAASIADAVWEENIDDHSGTGDSTAEALDNARNDAGAAATPAEVNAQCDIAISDAALATAANLATVDTVVDAIKVKTDNLPADTATELDNIDAAIAAIDVTADITISPVQSNIASPVDARDDIIIYVDTDTPNIVWTILDSNNDAIDLSGGTVTFTAVNDHNEEISAWSKSTADDISISGASNNVATMTYTTTETANVASYTYELKLDSQVIAYGWLHIKEVG